MIYLSVRSLTPGVLTPVGRDVCMYVCMYVCICESMAHSLAIPPSLLQRGISLASLGGLKDVSR